MWSVQWRSRGDCLLVSIVMVLIKLTAGALKGKQWDSLKNRNGFTGGGDWNFFPLSFFWQVFFLHWFCIWLGSVSLLLALRRTWTLQRLHSSSSLKSVEESWGTVSYSARAEQGCRWFLTVQYHQYLLLCARRNRLSSARNKITFNRQLVSMFLTKCSEKGFMTLDWVANIPW